MNQIIFGVEGILVVYLAARFTLDGGMTVGMIFAFMSYKNQFTDKAARLVEQVLEFRILTFILSAWRTLRSAQSSPATTAP